MSSYELLVIHTPALTEQAHREALDKLKAVLAKNGAEVTKEDVWGKRRLAYLIEKQREGYYTILQFTAASTGPALAELDRFCKIEETVIRHLITKAVFKSLGTPLTQIPEGVMIPGEPRPGGRGPRRDRFDRGGDRGPRSYGAPAGGDAPAAPAGDAPAAPPAAE